MDVRGRGKQVPQRRGSLGAYGKDATALDAIRRENRRARRDPLQKALPVDPIDKLDLSFGAPFHHEGPYDSTLFSRQVKGKAPVDALRSSNQETIDATPPGSLVDSLKQKIPLDNVGSIPPGRAAPGGHIMDYREENLFDGNEVWGATPRHPSHYYRREDLAAKGKHSRYLSERGIGMEMEMQDASTSRRVPHDGRNAPVERRSGTVSGRLEGSAYGLKKRSSTKK